MKYIFMIVLALLISCAVALDCNPACYSDENCVEIGSNATCVCNYTSYNGKKISDFTPSLTCDDGAMVISLSRCLLDYFGYDYNTLQLTNKSEVCNSTFPNVVDSKRMQSLEVKVQTGWCGNLMTNDASKIYYTNTLHIGVQNSTVINVNPIEMNFTCSYNLTMQTSLNITLHPVLSTTYLTASNGEGSYPLTMAGYKDTDFTMPFQETDTVFVGEDIFLGLFVTDADGDKFALRAVQCLASPTNSRDDPNRVQLVSEGCAVDGDVDVTVEKNGETLEARIRLSSFKFQGFDSVYIFCDARLCDKAENCTGCQNGRSSEPGTGQVMLSLNLDEKISYSSSGSCTAGFWAVLVNSLLIFLSSNLF
ncbi:pancreatic secretory granule membrane major glycoprotein GP2-like isoform 1-T2 [Discoglossus pictus]